MLSRILKFSKTGTVDVSTPLKNFIGSTATAFWLQLIGSQNTVCFCIKKSTTEEKDVNDKFHYK